MAQNTALWKQIEKTAGESESWADFLNEIFSSHGLFAELFPTHGERLAFLRKPENDKRLRAMFDESVRKHGLIEGSQPKKSANMLVRLPQSLHVGLKKEAEEEGVSLNQLVILKLAAQLKHSLYQQSKKRK